ncbi:MAG: glyoxalase, partial [Actinomycetota bacterium]|nr:glyoxalase [Actinomycetota bacterium]
MSSNDFRRRSFPEHGQIGYLQLPAADVARSATFYREVFGWSVDEEHASFQAPALIGQWITDREPAASAGVLLWICADDLYPTLERVVTHGGVVHSRPQLDGGERWLVEIADPAGNRLGMVVQVGAPQPQTLVAVRDVEASSRWYQHLLGLESDHGGPEYERLLSGGKLVLQLHRQEVEHHHGRIDNPADDSRGNGVLLWFGEVADFDDAVVRAGRLEAPIVRAPHRNPPEGQGNG